ncbi:uncharacterized protein KZ484_020481 [Pholidichthys leucotaenia]
MLRHYRARHENEVPDTPRIDSASRKQMLDEALPNFIVKDCQPLSIVESEGFRELVQALQPSYFANQKDHQTNGGQKVRGGTGTSENASTASCGNNLWQHLNIEVGRQTKSATADAIQEVQRYLAEGNIASALSVLDIAVHVLPQTSVSTKLENSAGIFLQPFTDDGEMSFSLSLSAPLSIHLSRQSDILQTIFSDGEPKKYSCRCLLVVINSFFAAALMETSSLVISCVQLIFNLL